MRLNSYCRYDDGDYEDDYDYLAITITVKIRHDGSLASMGV